ncbi:MAG: OmpA family protein [Bdellovibrionales bacterium]|nr:OmpA family protein [Bdellovibrionales bacterium]
MFRKFITVFLFVTFFSPAGNAYDLSKKIGLGLTGGYSIPVFGNPFNSMTDADFGFGVHGRYHFNESFLLETSVVRSEFDKSDVYFDNLNFLGVWRIKGSDNFTPILGAGLGLVRMTNFSPKSTKLSGLLRAGIDYGVGQWFSVGLFADYQYISKFLGAMPEKRFHIVTPQVALTWYFGGENKSYESLETKAPTSTLIAPPKESFVDESNLDSDEDGVKDPEDRCPSTAKSVKVNTIGCAIDEKATMQINVEFATSQSNLDAKYDSHMKEIAAFLTKYNEVVIQIEGHTDNTGSRAKNIVLSQKRADAVMNALVKEGISKSRLSAKGFGPDSPLMDNGSPEGRQTNRRVVAVLSSK